MTPHKQLMTAGQMKSLRKIISPSIGLLTLATALFARELKINFDHLTIRNGLSDGRVDCILQDSYGFLWFGTQDGLNRYDGYNCTVYDHDIYDSTSISSNWIRCLYEDNARNLWIGTEGGGLNRFQHATGRFSRWVNEPGNPHSLPDNFVRAILEDSHGALWIGTRSGMVQFDWQKNSFISFRSQPDDPDSPVFAENVTEIIEDRDCNVWIGTPDNIYRYERARQTIEHIAFDKEPVRISALFEDRDGNIWIGSRYNGLRKYDRRTHDFILYKNDPDDPYSLGSNEIKEIFEDRDGSIWVATVQGGLNLFIPQTNGFYHYWNEPNDPSSLSSNSVRTIYQDRNGKVWIGMDGSGVDSFTKNSPKFRLFSNRVGNPQDLGNQTILAIFEDENGVLWIGTEGGGLNMLVRRDQKFLHYRAQKNESHSLSSDHITGIYSNDVNELWIATKEGLNRFDCQKKIFQRFYNRTPPVTGHNFINVICELPGERLLLGTNSGLCIFKKDSGQFQTLLYSKDNPLNYEAVESIWMESPNLIWVGYLRSGLVKFNLSDTTYIHYRADETHPNSLSDNFVQYLYQDRTGNLWIATRQGLNQLNPATGNFRLFTKTDGLPSNVVVGILEDSAQNLWLGTTNGLSRFNIKEQTFINYDLNDGLQGNQFWVRSCFKNKKGELFFGGNNGFNVFAPDSFKIAAGANAPPVVITGVTVLDKILPLNFYADTTTLVFSYQQNRISFEFAALNFIRPEKNQFIYRLEGFDNDWIRSGTRHYANYTNLDPGNYVFRVKGASAEGIWNETGASLSFRIKTPFWRTWWAYLIYIGLAAGIIYGVNAYIIGLVRIRHDLKIERMEKEKTREINQFKLQLFTDVAHELKTPLTLILSPLEEIIGTFAKDTPLKNEFRIMHRSVKYLLRLTNQLLTFQRAEQGREVLKVSQGDLAQFAREVFEMFQDTARKHHISYSLNSPSKIEGYFDWEKLEEILINIIDNAFKYTSDHGAITVNLAPDGEQKLAIIEVSDNGMGINPENMRHLFERFFQARDSLRSGHSSTGIGLALTKKLVELHHGTIAIVSPIKDSETSPGAERGCRVIVSLPLDRDYYRNDELASNIEETAHYRALVKTTEATDFPEEDHSLISAEVVTDPHSPLLLLIDDNDEFRAYLRKTLSRKYRLAEAADGAEGLEVARQLMPSIVISDLMMPRIDGLELCRRLKNDIATSHIPIILLTARTAIDSKIEGLETGADDYIEKPFHFRFLDARIKNILKSREKLRERYRRELLLEPQKVSGDSADVKFLLTVRNVVISRLSDPNLVIRHLAAEAGLSRTNLFLKLKALTGLTPQEFIKTIRLEQAAQLLHKTNLTVAEIAYRVGFKYPKYFSTCFLRQFQQSPSDYRKTKPA